VAPRPVLGLCALRPAFLVHLPGAALPCRCGADAGFRRGSARRRGCARCTTQGLNRGRRAAQRRSMTPTLKTYPPDMGDPDDDEDEDDDDEEDDDDDEEDDEDEEEEEEGWRVRPDRPAGVRV
jgi:hypothetical protein